MNTPNAGSLVFRFWSLPASTRREIAIGLLGALPPEELALPEVERYKRIFAEVRVRGLVDSLAEAVALCEQQDGDRP